MISPFTEGVSFYLILPITPRGVPFSDSDEEAEIQRLRNVQGPELVSNRARGGRGTAMAEFVAGKSWPCAVLRGYQTLNQCGMNLCRTVRTCYWRVKEFHWCKTELGESMHTPLIILKFLL